MGCANELALCLDMSNINPFVRDCCEYVLASPIESKYAH
jgi:hypothetical protein